jgi:hypothetical protein
MFKYHVFLSHAAADADEADKVRDALIAAKFRVYCDRHDDSELDRSKVSAETANVLRDRMRVSNAMVYVVSASARLSKWMPWELGFFDGIRGKVLIYPVDEAARETAKHQEYLSLYTILEPGSLEATLRLETEQPNNAIALPNAFNWANAVQDPKRDIAAIGMLKEQGFMAPADAALTGAYRDRIGAAVKAQDFDQIFRIQLDIWQAWLRLWGVRV